MLALALRYKLRVSGENHRTLGALSVPPNNMLAAYSTLGYSTLAAATVEPLRLDGLVAATFSPFTAAGDLNVSVVPAQNAYLKATGVDWVFVGGTTGESLSLSLLERKALTEAWLATSASVIAHAGAECLGDAREIAAHAQAKGAKAIGAMPPTFFKPASSEALAVTIASICAAAPKLPCYYYHIPSMTGVDPGSMYDLMIAIEPLAPNFAGIKYTGLYTSPGYMDVMRILAYKGGKYEVLSGREEMMLEGLAAGLKGHVGSQFNFAGDLYNQIRETFAAKGLTPDSQAEIRGLQLKGIELVHAWLDAAPTGVNGAKAFQNMAGVPVGDARLPSLPVGDGAAALTTAFKAFCSDYAAVAVESNGKDAVSAPALKMCEAH